MDINVDLSDHSAVVTGGNSGIGKGIALSLAEQGAKVAICGQNRETLEATEEQLREHTPDSFGRQVDVREQPEQTAFFNEVEEEFGGLDICVPNAGRAHLGNVSDTSLEDWNRDVDTNLTGLFITSKLALEIMKKQESGYILPIISKAGTRAFELRASYCASKWGALGFTHCLDEEASQYGIEVTAINPASVDTPFQEGNPRGTDWMMEPEDVAEAVLYVLGSSSRVHIDDLLLQNSQSPSTD